MLRLTPVVKNLLFVTVAVFIIQNMIQVSSAYFSLWPLSSDYWRPYQFFSYMFAHSTDDILHLVFNMLLLFFLGPLLEQFWGTKKFLAFYMITGIGAGVLYNSIAYVKVWKTETQVQVFLNDPNPESFNLLVAENDDVFKPGIYDFIDEYSDNPDNPSLQQMSVNYANEVLNRKSNSGPMLGASGAVYGILMAMGLLFPNTELRLFLLIPVKVKYIVFFMGAEALYSALINDPTDNTAHFAHLGGMVFAFIMIQIWKKDRNQFY